MIGGNRCTVSTNEIQSCTKRSTLAHQEASPSTVSMLCIEGGGMQMQTQSMTITVIFEDASTLDYKSSILNRLKGLDWSENIWDILKVE